ncbi:hypothetical protein [Streptomyces sp. enrichment culture]|uniref:hypothetical protein n=1 Tax=Streptomyces sp. enrichment culture TaxID=1795815 RepID=UPI003F56A2B9
MGLRSRLLASLTATAALLMTGLTAQPASAVDAPTVTKLSLGADQFKLTDTSTVSAANNLYNNVLTDHATLTDVVTTDYTKNSAGATDPWLNLRSMRACTGDETKALPPVTTKTAWCWSHAHSDDTTPHWWPQGLSTTGTADGGDGAIQGRRVTAVSWHYEVLSGEKSENCTTQNMLKLTFLDRDTAKYRHVFLAEPTGSGTNFKLVTGHGGGIVWYGNYIYVTDTANGIRVFDIDRMAKVDRYGSDVHTYGVDSGGRSSACGYPYVVPQVHYYKQAGTPSSCQGDVIDPQYLCFSWLSLDKTGDGPYKLVTGEWYKSVDGGRVVRYQLNPAGSASYPGLLNMSGGKTVIQDAYAASRYRGLQGGMTWTDSQGVLNFAFHKGCGTKPGVYSHTWAGDTRATTSCAAGGNWAVGPPQALSHWPRLGTTQVEELWGQTEGICAGSALRAAHEADFPVITEAGNACTGYEGVDNLSLRAVFAVGFDDPAVQSLH